MWSHGDDSGAIVSEPTSLLRRHQQRLFAGEGERFLGEGDVG